MNEQSFVERRESDWQRLQWLLDKADGGAARLEGAELKEVLRLYRRTSTDLAIVRTQSTNQPLIDFLNDLIGRGYGILYQAPRRSLWHSIVEAAEVAAQTFRRRFPFILASFGVFLFAVFWGYTLLRFAPHTREVLLPPGADEMFEGWKSGTFDKRTGSDSVMMSGFYLSNNPRVAIIAGAVGAGSFGFLSVYLEYQNGLLLGTLAHEVAQVGHLDFLLSSIAPHGVPELMGAWVSGGAGLLLGWALIHPGRRSRADSLRAVGRDAIVLLAISVVLMFIAAPIEGFFSFNPSVPGWLKVFVATAETVAWIAFWGFFGKQKELEADRTA